MAFFAYFSLVGYAGATLAFYVGSAVGIHRRRIRPGGQLHVALLGFGVVFSNRFMRVLAYMGRQDLVSGEWAAPGTLRAEAGFLLSFFTTLTAGLAFVAGLQAVMRRGWVALGIYRKCPHAVWRRRSPTV